jgi:hypothetical protein
LEKNPGTWDDISVSQVSRRKFQPRTLTVSSQHERPAAGARGAVNTTPGVRVFQKTGVAEMIGAAR